MDNDDKMMGDDMEIYAIKFFFRGKPWLVAVDDEAMFYEDINGDVSQGLLDRVCSSFICLSIAVDGMFC
jgi:hypothetical protein